MSVVQYLDVTGVMQNENKWKRRFVLPDRNNVTRSLRFGTHVCALKETMQILPVGNLPEGNYDRPALRSVMERGGQDQTRKFIKAMLSGLNVRALLM